MAKKITKDKIRPFDFSKKPGNPCFLLTLAKWIISWPDLRKRGFQLLRNDMEGVKEPYLLLVTHSSMVDFNIMLKVTHPGAVNNVMTLEGFNTYTKPLMRSLGVLGTRKFITDMHLIKNIKYCVDELENIFVLFPEARYSLEGCNSFLPDSLGKLTKLLKVPVALLRIHGNFVTCPQWNKMNKKTYVEAEVLQLFSAEEVAEASAKEINEKIRREFVYDDFRWQLENRIKIDHPKRAVGLHRLLYKCAACGQEGQMNSQGTRLWCDCCHKEWEMDEYGQLSATEGETEFSHIPDWSNWERDCVREEIQNGTYYFEDDVRIETLPNSWKFYKQGMGRLIQTPTETRIECNYYGEEYTLVRTAKSMDSLHIEYDYLGRGDCVDISVPDDSFWCYVSKRDVITKLAFATEEMYKLASAEAKAAKQSK